MTTATTGAPTPCLGTRLKLSASRKMAIWHQLPQILSTSMCLKDVPAEALLDLHGWVAMTLIRKALGGGQTVVLLNSHPGGWGNQTMGGADSGGVPQTSALSSNTSDIHLPFSGLRKLAPVARPLVGRVWQGSLVRHRCQWRAVVNCCPEQVHHKFW